MLTLALYIIWSILKGWFTISSMCCYMLRHHRKSCIFQWSAARRVAWHSKLKNVWVPVVSQCIFEQASGKTAM